MTSEQQPTPDQPANDPQRDTPPDGRPPDDSDAVAAEIVESDVESSPRSTMEQLTGSKLLVVCLLYGAALFLGLPVLWWSPVFSRAEKLLHTLLVLIWTTIVFWLFYRSMAYSISRIMEAL